MSYLLNGQTFSYTQGMEFIKVAILGIIQGITEWLPISSTGHLILADEFIHLGGSEEFKYLFTVVVQLGSILAVIVLYWSTLNPFKRDRSERNMCLTLWAKVLVASIPAGVVGILIDDIVDEKLSTWPVIATALFVYGILYIIIEKKLRIKVRIKDTESVSYMDALKLGVFQMLALIPGTSRSGSTILGGMLLGFDRTVAAKFSFFMAIPVMAGASLLRLLRSGFALTGEEWGLLLSGTLVSFLVSLVVIRKLVDFVRTHDFSGFGVYRIILSILIVLYFAVL